MPGAVTLENSIAMMKMTSVSPVGTLVYLIKEQSLLVRVDNGWQYILVTKQLKISSCSRIFTKIKF